MPVQNPADYQQDDTNDKRSNQHETQHTPLIHFKHAMTCDLLSVSPNCHEYLPRTTDPVVAHVTMTCPMSYKYAGNVIGPTGHTFFLFTNKPSFTPFSAEIVTNEAVRKV